MKNPLECNSLDELRKEIDRIDKEIIELLGDRYNYVKEVVKYRTPGKREIADQERFNHVIKERGQWASNHGLDPEVIELVYRQLLNYFVREQSAIANLQE